MIVEGARHVSASRDVVMGLDRVYDRDARIDGSEPNLADEVMLSLDLQ
jgi:hypothetical protein